MSKGTRFELDEIRVKAKLSGMTERAQYALDNQVLKDTDAFVPFASGMMAKSAASASEPGKGVIRWETPYVRAQYYSRPNKSGAVHPRATMKWFDAARAAYLRSWIQTAKRAARIL